MEIKVNVDGAKASIAPVGKLTVQTASELDAAVGALDKGVSSLDFDFAELDYISSAGLRVLVSTQKMMTARDGAMRILNPNDDVFEVFDMTGLAEVLDVVR